MKAIEDIGISIILSLQGLGGWLAAPIKLITFLGTVEFYLLLMPALYWCWDMRLGLRTGVLLMLSGGLNDVVKIALHQPRPFWIDQRVQPLSFETNFGLPSGHAQNGIAVWGLMAHALRRRWAWPSALVLTFLISLSRAYLGVHFPHSLLFGWLVGGLLLSAFLRWEAPVRRWLKDRSLGQQVLAAFLGSLALLGLSALSLLSLRDWQVPAAWAQAALASTGEPIDPLTPKYAFTSAGVLFGMGAGAAWLLRAGGFRSDGPVGKRLTRYVLGMVGLLGLWFGLGAVMPHDASLLSLVVRYVTAALAGVWVSAAAPALFLRWKLAEKGGESGS